MQGLGLVNALVPAIRRIPNPGGKSLLERHLGYFNCNPNFTPLIVGGVLKLEVERAAGRPVTEENIAYFKKSISNPLAAMGDLLFLGGLKPLALTLAILSAIYHFYIGLLLVFILYNLAVLSCRLWGVYFGYAKGWELVDVFTGPIFQRVLSIVQVVGACTGGVLIGVVLNRLPQSGTWVPALGVILMGAALYMSRRDISLSRFAIILFPLSVVVALVLS
jgi:PTS system mannose-specific IID component